MSIAFEEPERRATSLRSPVWPHPPSTVGGDCAGAHGDSSPVGPGRAPARSAGAARNRPFSGSCSRSYRCGRNRTNGVIVVEARRIRETGLRAEAKRSRGQPRRRDRRPADGRRSGSSVLATIVTDRRERVVLAARSQTPPRPSGRGVTRSAVTGASEDCSSVDVAGRKRPRRKAGIELHPKCVGRRETRHASGRGPRKGNTPPDHRTKRGCPSSKCRWQKLVARISGR